MTQVHATYKRALHLMLLKWIGFHLLVDLLHNEAAYIASKLCMMVSTDCRVQVSSGSAIY